jgi:hypothetical protein
MIIEKLKELVSNSDLKPYQKNSMAGFIARAKAYEEANMSDVVLIEQIVKGTKYPDVIISTDEVKIYRVSGTDEWSVKYPYRSIFLKDGRWMRSDTVSPTLEIAMLVYLEKKYDGDNSQFTSFAMRMLRIKAD